MDKQDPKINVSSIDTSSKGVSSSGKTASLNAQRNDPNLSKLSSSDYDIQAVRSAASLNQPSDSSGWLTGLFVLLIVAVVAGGFGIYTVHTQVIDLQDQAQAREAVISQLQQRLSSTGESATSSLDALTVKDNQQDSEIRKLWDVSNKRNKKQIASNRTQLASLSSSMTSSKQQLSRQEKKLTGFAQTQLSLKDRVDNIDTLERQVKENQQATTSADVAIAQNREENQQQQDILKQLQTQIDGLKQQTQADELLSIQLSLDDIQVRLNRLETP